MKNIERPSRVNKLIALTIPLGLIISLFIDLVFKEIDQLYEVAIIDIFTIFIPSLFYLKIKPIRIFHQIKYIRIKFLILIVSLSLSLQTIFNIYFFEIYRNYITSFDLSISILFSLLIITICEEILYRYCLLESYRTFNKVQAIILSSLIFSLIHLNLYAIPYYFIVALILGYIYYSFNNIWYAIIGHLTLSISSIYQFREIKYLIAFAIVTIMIICFFHKELQYFFKIANVQSNIKTLSIVRAIDINIVFVLFFCTSLLVFMNIK